MDPSCLHCDNDALYCERETPTNTWCGDNCQQMFYVNIDAFHPDTLSLFAKMSHMRERDIFNVVAKTMTDKSISAEQKYKEMAILYDKANIKLVKKLPVQDYSQLHSMYTQGLVYALKSSDDKLRNIIVSSNSAMATMNIAGTFIAAGRNDLLRDLLKQPWARKTMGNWKANQVKWSFKAPTAEKQKEAEALLAEFKKIKR